MQIDENVELEIKNLNSFGQGVATHKGLKIFVHGGLPEERALVTITDVKKKFATD